MDRAGGVFGWDTSAGHQRRLADPAHAQSMTLQRKVFFISQKIKFLFANRTSVAHIFIYCTNE
jgi:hypothetical protein